ncbi:MAG: Asp-tRNA(Asn)/Glu-tRNA(Gln) amidotransferase subunit GatB [Candidatus Improbicoccus devescovinae]|nr:MAG: Asp-tRNA(Asn)/Glu-tRNA(Gln) amidotransferase subunit GatB [Candidatus Improbicoccus devescovinae]
MEYELVCGLETHIELSTNTKIFCNCSTKFGGEPNTSCCPICLGMPGSLPTLNKNVIKYAIMMGCALDCKINLRSKMERKNYVYPDLPKAYQISQFEAPICTGGYVLLSNGRKIRINHIHMEEDAGKIVHKNNSFFIDYNRGGVPLLEIVSEPDIRSSEEVKEYVEILRSISRYLGISDGRMQEGSLRCDVNISVREKGSQDYGVRIEIKNMNSINFIANALESEFERQIQVLNSRGKLVQETRKYNENTNKTESMREKEDAMDYRYFVEPDIKEIELDDVFIKNIQKELPVLPNVRLNYYKNELNIPEKISKILVKYVKISDFLNHALKTCEHPIIAANFITGTIFSCLETENEREEFNIFISPEDFAYFVNLSANSTMDQGNFKKILKVSLEENKNLRKLIDDYLSSAQKYDINDVCEQVIANNKKAVSDYINGTDNAFQAILGAAMRITKGQIDASQITQALRKKLTRINS